MWLLLALACGGPDDAPADTAPQPPVTTRAGEPAPLGEHEVYEDEGTACLASPDDGGVSADDAGEISVTLGCAPCDAFVESALCDATADGTAVIVVADAVVHIEPNPDPDCPCTPVEAYCAAPPLEAGSWTLSYGGATVTFEVPAADAVCVESAGSR